MSDKALQDMKVFVVESDPNHISNLLSILEKNGFKKIVVFNTVKAAQQQLLSGTSCDIVFVNWETEPSDISNISFCKAITYSLDKAAPVIITTGEDNFTNRLQSFEAGSLDYVTKPYTESKLIRKLRAIFTSARFRETQKKRQTEKLQIYFRPI